MRSPVLGFNHNLRHMGLVFHVQTEDSGVKAPHIMTHLFHGGVILGSKKMDYDPASAEDIVKALMQAQHKSVLRELKGGKFNEKIEKYFGDKGESVPAAAAEAAAIAVAAEGDGWKVNEPGADRAISATPVAAEGTFTEPALDRPAVVVSRPAVIVGAPPTVIGQRAEALAREAPLIDADQVENIFGQDLISEKSLDEVILAYLSEDTSDD